MEIMLKANDWLISTREIEAGEVMKGIILAGGTGSRLYPLTRTINKHLLPVGRYPMIFHPLIHMVAAGIENILIITGRSHIGDIAKTLGSGTRFGCDLTYRIQDRPSGIAHALQLAEDFVGGEPALVILGDNIFTASLQPHIEQYQKLGIGAMVVLSPVADPGRYGVVQIQRNEIISIEEKPASPNGNLAVTGIYFYDNQVFRFIREISPSRRGEYEITDVNRLYLRSSKLRYSFLDGQWLDAGTFPSLHAANQIMEDVSYPYIE
jgi:glucose-1-phosphate thymidylyltransferase